MRKSSLILIGAGGHARACIDVIEHLNDFEIGTPMYDQKVYIL